MHQPPHKYDAYVSFSHSRIMLTKSTIDSSYISFTYNTK
uniref:Uncharacterized protein n=1 Tax=Acinetobacter phage vB_Ab_1137_KEN_05 TaxID=3143020 RepID=A0AAU8KWI0_9VIRU